LIQHHFHSKDRLRAAVDGFVLGQAEPWSQLSSAMVRPTRPSSASD
jgi:hypothetical protein